MDRGFLLNPVGISLVGFALLAHGLFSYWLMFAVGFIPAVVWILGIYFLVCVAYDRAITFRKAKRKNDEPQQEETSSYLFGVGR